MEGKRGIDIAFVVVQDYDGQRKAEYLFELIITLSSVIGFIVGYFMGMFSVTLIILAVGAIFTALLTIPPWPMYRRRPLKWQKPHAN